MFHWLLAGALLFLAGAIVVERWTTLAAPRVDPDEAALVAAGRPVYARHCADCHGANLGGQPGWRERLPNGRMPAPPHDASGHTWHHPDAMLFGIVKEGLVPGKFAPAGYVSDMPAFGAVLSDDEIRAVLAYIKRSWPAREQAYQRQLDRGSRDRRR